MSREVSPNSRTAEIISHPISRGTLFFLLGLLSLAVKDGEFSILGYKLFTVPVTVFQIYAVIAFLLSIAYLIAVFKEKVALRLRNLFEARTTSRAQYLCASFYFMFYLSAFLLVFIAGLVLGVTRTPYDYFQIPLLLVGLIWLGLIGFTFARHIIHHLKEKRLIPQVPPSSREPASEYSDPLMPDNPLDDPSLDRFKRFPFAQRVAQAIASKEDPSSLVIGIYGEWGAGKTTVLNFIARELKNRPNVICIRFNPWYFEDETHMLLNFFQTLSEVLGRKISTQAEDIGKWLRDYGSIIAPISLSLGGVIQLSPGEIAKKTGEAFSSPSIFALRERIEKILRNEKKRVVIIVDDIDRLDKHEIQTIFKLVKLLADFPYTAYVLAFDEEVVTSALEEKYGSVSDQFGTSFLEKIVQVPLKLPVADKVSLRELCFKHIDKALNEAEIRLTEDQGTTFAHHFIDGLEIRVQTPRMAKRYGNALSFSLPILKGEVNTIDLMLIEGLRVFYPKVYDTVRCNPDVFLGSSLTISGYDAVKKHGSDIINECTGGLTNDEANSVKNLLKVLFPRVQTILSNVTYGGEWDKTWADGQHVASSKYFDRYFSYSVPEGDISDQEIASLLQKLDTQGPTEIGGHLRETATERNVETLLYKLRIKEKKLGAQKSRNLALALSSIGDIFPNPDIPFSFTNPFHQAAILIGQLVENLPEGTERLSLGEAIVKEGKPISFAAECLTWMRTPKEKEGDNRILSKNEEQILEQIIVSRIRDISGDKLLYRDFPPKDARLLLSIWSHYSSKDETDHYLTNSFRSSRENVIEFLKCYMPTSWELESGLPRRGDFEREQYDAVVKVVDPDNILDALEELYGPELNSPEYQELSASLDIKGIDGVIAHQFVYIHNLVKNKGKKQDGTETSD